MRFDKRYRPDVCAAKDEARPVLRYVNVQPWKKGWIGFAADGFIASAISVEMEDDDVPGPVFAPLFAKARSLAGRRDTHAKMVLEADWVVFTDGSRYPRRHAGIDSDKFPALQRILPTLTTTPEAGADVCLNANLIRQASQALGEWGLVFLREGPATPCLVHGINRAHENPYEPPFVLLMPMGGADFARIRANAAKQARKAA